MNSLYLIILTLGCLLNLVASKTPPIFGGGCGIVDGVLYHVGGSTYNKKNKTLSYDRIKTVYSLNLMKGFELEDGLYAPWQPIQENKSPSAYIPGVVVHKPSKSIYMLGGEKTLKEEGFQVFDTKNKKWIDDKAINSNFPTLKLSGGEDSKYSLYVGSFVSDDLNENMFYQYGGMMNNNNLTGYESFANVMIYNAVSNRWTYAKPNGVRATGHTAQFHKGKMYVIGGIGSGGLTLLPMNQAMVFDTSSLKWRNITIKGKAPSARFGLSSVMVDSYLVILSGTESTKFDSFPNADMFYIDLKDSEDLTWTRIPIDGYIPSAYGCLAYYNDHLIYSFGLRTELVSTTQIINMKTKELVQALPAYDEDDSNIQNPTKSVPRKISSDKDADKNPEESQLNLPAIIGGSVGGFIFLLIIGISVWYFIRRRNNRVEEKLILKTNSNSKSSSPTPPSVLPTAFPTTFSYQTQYQPPTLLQANIWSDKPIEIADPKFSLDNNTLMPNIDNDLGISQFSGSSSNTKTR